MNPNTSTKYISIILGTIITIGGGLFFLQQKNTPIIPAVESTQPQIQKVVEPKTIQTNTEQNPFTSPVEGQVVNIGDTLTIKWDPKAINGASVSLFFTSSMGGSPYENNPEILLKSTNNLNDPIHSEGVLNYVIGPFLNTIYPGFYHIRVTDSLQRKTILSPTFEIKSPIFPFDVYTGAALTLKRYYMMDTSKSDIPEATNNYLLIAQIENNRQEPASPDKKYNATLVVLDKEGNRMSDGLIQGIYNERLGGWQFEISDYIRNAYDSAVLTAWCADYNLTSTCAQRGDKQIDQTISLKDIEMVPAH